MLCPKCKNELVVEDKNYKCPSCQIFLPVVFYAYRLKQEDIDKLVLEGVSDEIEFFSKTKKKKFKAKLVYKNGKVDFEFCSNKENEKKTEEGETEKENNTVCIFLNSLSSGVIRVFTINGCKKEEKIYDFGTTATRYAEALALLAILPTIPHEKKIKIVADNIQFVKYVLGEETPRDREIRFGINILAGELRNYDWQVELCLKRLKLKGGNAKRISLNLFPYIKINQIQQQNGILVVIENCNLAVEKHFLEFIQKAKKLSFGKFMIADEMRERFNDWTNKVVKPP